MENRITIDKAGRVVIPKAVRDDLRLCPGDTLQLDSQDDVITLAPVREVAPLLKEQGVWVYRSGKLPTNSIVELIDRMREDRIQDLTK